MDLFAHFENKIVTALSELKSEGILLLDSIEPPKGFSVEPSKEASHGDIATNVALLLAKQVGRNPREIAENIAAKLALEKDIQKIEIAGPGFINLTIAPAFWAGIIKTILIEGDHYGRGKREEKERINIEYVSANPTGPLHVGHCRGAVFGDALANLLEFAGFDVAREYYINDAGAQVDILARSAYLRYREALGQEIGEIPEGLYPGDYLKPVGKRLVDLHGTDLLAKCEEDWLPLVRDVAIDAMMDVIRADLAVLNIRHETFFSERTLISGDCDKVRETIDWLRENELVYEGRLPPPKGKLPDDWEDREQTLFRATAFGDEIDRALVKADGGYTYFASDMAYHRDKFLRHFKMMINVWGADHSGYIKRMQAAVKALTGEKAELDVKVCQLVRLFRQGVPVKMSKRSGDFVTLRDVVEEVGPDPVRFMMVFRRNDAPLDFDFVKVLDQSRDNPVFYVQYAHARAHSVFRNLKPVFPNINPQSLPLETLNMEQISDPAEISLIKRLAFFPRLIETASRAHEPHRIAFYLHDLAADFHSLWTRGKESPHLRFICEDDEPLTQARLALVVATAGVLRLGLGILGVHAIKEMR